MRYTLALAFFSLLITSITSAQAGLQWNMISDSATIDSSKIIPGGLEGWRDIPWGTSASKVAAIEGLEVLVEGALTKQAIFGGIPDVMWLALCGPEGLTMGTYFASPDFSEDMRYIELFQQWQANLIDKYGPPSSQGENWHNPKYRDEVEQGILDRGWVFQLGHLSYNGMWLFEDNSAIGLRLNTDMPLMPSGPALVLGYFQDVSAAGNEKW